MAAYVQYIAMKCLIGLCCLLAADGVRLTITPATVQIGGESITSTPVPTTTPPEVVMECNTDNTYGGIDTIFSIYIKRKQGLETDFRNIVELVINKLPELSDNAPNDIRTKNPILEGTIDLSNQLNSRLRARFMVSTLNCLDEAQYQCKINYKPTGSETTDMIDEKSLSVTILPGNLEISARRTQNFYPTSIVNLTSVNRADQLEFMCTGSIGEVQTAVIQWYTRSNSLYEFQQFYPASAEDSIDDGTVPGANVCPYSRTSILRYTVPTTTSLVAQYAFRCEVAQQFSTGGTFRAYSQEFHIDLAYLQINGVPRGQEVGMSLLLLLFLLSSASPPIAL